jgi:excisionase family DNA binding protein
MEYAAEHTAVTIPSRGRPGKEAKSSIAGSGLDLPRIALEAPATELPELVGSLAEAQAVALARLTAAGAPSTPPQDQLLTMPEVAERLAITEHRAREMGRRGELPVVTVGERFVRVRRSALEEWVRRRENGRRMRREGDR